MIFLPYPLTVPLPPGWDCVAVYHVSYPTDSPTANVLRLCSSLVVACFSTNGSTAFIWPNTLQDFYATWRVIPVRAIYTNTRYRNRKSDTMATTLSSHVDKQVVNTTISMQPVMTKLSLWHPYYFRIFTSLINRGILVVTCSQVSSYWNASYVSWQKINCPT